MAYLLIPEFNLKTIIDAILLYIRSDYSSNGDDSYLSKLVNGIKLDKYDIYEQATEVFITRGKNHPQELKCNLFFNTERASVPTVHIMLAEDSTGPNGIGIDPSIDGQVYDVINQTIKETYNRAFDSRISLVITSANSIEAIMIYHILRASLVSVFNDLQFAGIQNPKLSGGTLNINPELVPLNIFYQVINIDYFYDVKVPSIFTQETFAEFVSLGVALATETTDDSSS
jgi:hypothetical protein